MNLSVTQLQSVDLVQRVRAALDESGLPPDQLELEITESTAMQSPETSLRVLSELKKLLFTKPIPAHEFGSLLASLFAT